MIRTSYPSFNFSFFFFFRYTVTRGLCISSIFFFFVKCTKPRLPKCFTLTQIVPMIRSILTSMKKNTMHVSLESCCVFLWLYRILRFFYSLFLFSFFSKKKKKKEKMQRFFYIFCAVSCTFFLLNSTYFASRGPGGWVGYTAD